MPACRRLPVIFQSPPMCGGQWKQALAVIMKPFRTSNAYWSWMDRVRLKARVTVLWSRSANHAVWQNCSSQLIPPKSYQLRMSYNCTVPNKPVGNGADSFDQKGWHNYSTVSVWNFSSANRRPAAFRFIRFFLQTRGERCLRRETVGQTCYKSVTR